MIHFTDAKNESNNFWVKVRFTRPEFLPQNYCSAYRKCSKKKIQKNIKLISNFPV